MPQGQYTADDIAQRRNVPANSKGQYTPADVDWFAANAPKLPPEVPPVPAGSTLSPRSSAMVPMIAPDGRSGDIPQARVQDAVAAGFKPATRMISPDGQQGYIPTERVADATQAGFRTAAAMPTKANEDWFAANAPKQATNAASEPSLMDKARNAAEAFVNTIPGVGSVHELASVINDWANRKMSPENPHMLSPAATFGTGVMRDVAGLVKGATSPEGIATTAATIAAPEVMGPALMAHGVYSAVKGWGDLKNPDVLQNELNAGAEVAGGAAVTGSAIKAGGGPITQAFREKLNPSTQIPAKAAQDLQTAIPPSKSAPYADIDMQKARPYLEAEHGNTPIDSVTGLRDAADSAIGKIEDQISQKISQLPNARFKTNVIRDVTNALKASPRGQAFVDSGLKDLEDFNFSQPKTLADADAIRRQLNQENKAVLAKNNYDVATARATDPAFAAREAAAESLRDGIYKQLGANGMPNAQQLRLDEGSLIKIRNAAQNQIFNGDKVVRSTAQTGPMRTAAKAVTKGAATAAGGAMAGWPGAYVGREVGESLGNAFTPEGLTRNELIERSFSKPTSAPAARATPVAVSLPAAAAVSNAAANRIPSMGSVATLRDLLASGITQ